MKVRIKFSKHGSMKYIGHLDIMRYFQKAIRRADIPIKYSTGFSPHQVMSFAQPLGVGMESDGEYFDIEVTEKVYTNEAKAALNAVMVEGMRVEEVVILPDDVKNAMASVAAASYQVVWKKEKAPAFDLAGLCTELLQKPSIPYTKTTKKSTLELDLKPGIYALEKNELGLYLMVDASSSGNIKPTMILELLYGMAETEIPEYAWQITRLDTFAKDDTGSFVPLGAFGNAL